MIDSVFFFSGVVFSFSFFFGAGVSNFADGGLAGSKNEQGEAAFCEVAYESGYFSSDDLPVILSWFTNGRFET